MLYDQVDYKITKRFENKNETGPQTRKRSKQKLTNSEKKHFYINSVAAYKRNAQNNFLHNSVLLFQYIAKY